MQDRILKFLKNFDNPVLKILQSPEEKASKKIPKCNLWYGLEESLALNDQYPSTLCFIPNGQYGLVNRQGEEIKFSEGDKPDNGHVSALVIDFDMKDTEFKNLDQFYKHITEKIASTVPLKPSYIIKSGNGFHVYWVIKKEDRDEVHMAFGKDVYKITDTLCKKLGADQNARVSQSYAGLIRLPGSYNWKNGSKKAVEFMLEAPENVLTTKDIQNSLRYIYQQEEVTKEILRFTTREYTNEIYQEAKQIPMEQLLQKLEKYPKKVDGVNAWIRISGTQVYIEKEDGETIRRNSYKYNKADNYINCFFEGDMEKAPVGNGYGFLYRYFNKSTPAVLSFLEEEFKIRASNSDRSLGKILEIYDEYMYSIVIYEGGVVLEIDKPSGDKVIHSSKILIRKPLRILGKGFISDASMGEAEKSRTYIVEINGQETYMSPSAGKRDHNKIFKDKLFFLGDDNDVGLFFTALDSSDKIPEVEIYGESGYYDGVCLLSGKPVYGELGSARAMPRIEFELASEDLEQVSVKSFFELYRTIYKDSVAVPTFLQALALGGMNLWEKFNTYPALLISGITGSGKSQMAKILKRMLGYADNARSMSLPGITPQPLKQSASDFSVLFLEELTQKVGETTEELLRNIVNRDKGARGMQERNVEFVFRAPLFVVGERTFKDESLNNRFVTIVSDRKAWKQGGKPNIHKIEGWTAYKEIYETFYKAGPSISEKAKEYSNMLVADHEYDSRIADVLSFMFVTNDLFKLGIDQEELLKICKILVKRVGTDKNVEVSCWEQVSNIILKGLSRRNGALNARDDGKDLEYVYVFYDDDEYQKSRGQLYSAVMEINEELGDEFGVVSKNRITFRVPIKKENFKWVDESSIKVVSFFENIAEFSPDVGFINIKSEHAYV